MKSGSRFPGVFTAVSFLLFAGLYLAGVFHGMQGSWQDRLFARSSTLKEGDPRLILVSIDDETGKKYGFPLPRTVYAQALDKLKALGVRTAVFDVMFLDPREGDADLAAATKRFGRVVHLFAQEVQHTPNGPVVNNLLPVPPLLKAGKHFGHPNVEWLLDDDGHLRRFELLRTGVRDPLHGELDAATIEAATLSADQDKTLQQVVAEYGVEIKVLNYRRPKAWLRHEKKDEGREGVANLQTIDSPYRRISMIDVLSGDLTKAQKAALKGSIALFGSTALGYFDHYPTPFSEAGPGVEFHMNALDNLLHGDFMRSWPAVATVAMILIAVLLTFWLRLLPPAAGAAGAAAALAVWYVASLKAFDRGVILEFIPPAVAMVASYLVLVVHRALTEGAEKKLIKGMFGQFVSPEVVEELANNPERAKLGAQKKNMTVFFLDIAHFTTISEKMGPEALMAFLNKYLSALSQEVMDRRGTIDKYIGDCIMAFWNAPLENKDHRKDAVLAALKCQEVIERLNKDLDPGLPEIPAIRIGVNSGDMNVGFTGTDRKLQYTVIGDEVNLASRLEGANKFFGSRIIISENTWSGAQDVAEARYLGKARVVGKATPIPVYEPLAEKGKLAGAWREALPVWEKAIKTFYDKKYEDALPLFEDFMKRLPEDGPGDVYLKMARDYAVLPPDDWDQVFNLTAK